MKTVYVTGCDSNYFLMTGVLLGAFKKYCPSETLYVCDFGLTLEQKRCLLEAGILLEKPPGLADNQHPWVYKSSLFKYIEHLSADIVVWMDGDCFPVGPFTQEVDKVTAEWEQGRGVVALCQGKLGKTWKLASPESNITHFRMQPDYPYYNSGVWMLHSNKVLQEWTEEIAATPKNGMFEQDTFNYLLYKNNIFVQTLKNDIWNVTHDGLNELSVIPETDEVLLKGHPVLIIHITGDYSILNISVGPFSGAIRTLKDKAIRDIQIRLLKSWIIPLCK